MAAGADQPQFGYVRGPAGVLEDFRLRKLPRWIVYVAIVGAVASWIPLAIIFRARYNTSTEPRIHFFQDMDNQTKFRPQDENKMFADNRAMRPAVVGAVARGQLNEDDHFIHGYTLVKGADGKPTPQFFNRFPAAVQAQLDNPATAEALLRHGQERFNIYCAACHGQDGQGKGPIHLRADELTRNGVQGMQWVAPSSLVDMDRRNRADGHLYNTITNGIRNMGGYASQINPADRWAIVAYVRTLQFAQSAKPEAVPEDKKDVLR
jgi:mono/diheme cytochrome c family protein